VDPSVCREHLAKLIDEEVNALTRLEGLLDQEHEHLLANDVEALERTGEARQACIGELVRVDDDRRTLCRMLNLPADRFGLDRMLKWCDPEATLQSRIAECAERAGRCRGLNDRNGALVTARIKKRRRHARCADRPHERDEGLRQTGCVFDPVTWRTLNSDGLSLG